MDAPKRHRLGCALDFAVVGATSGVLAPLGAVAFVGWTFGVLPQALAGLPLTYYIVAAITAAATGALVGLVVARVPPRRGPSAQLGLLFAMPFVGALWGAVVGAAAHVTVPDDDWAVSATMAAIAGAIQLAWLWWPYRSRRSSGRSTVPLIACAVMVSTVLGIVAFYGGGFLLDKLEAGPAPAPEIAIAREPVLPDAQPAESDEQRMQREFSALVDALCACDDHVCVDAVETRYQAWLDATEGVSLFLVHQVSPPNGGQPSELASRLSACLERVPIDPENAFLGDCPLSRATADGAERVQSYGIYYGHPRGLAQLKGDHFGAGVKLYWLSCTYESGLAMEKPLSLGPVSCSVVRRGSPAASLRCARSAAPESW